MDVLPTPKQLHRSSMRPRAAGLRLAACLACAASTIVITACGGGHSGATPSAPPPATGMPPTVPPMAPPSAPPAVPPSMPPAAPPPAPPAPPPATPPSAPPPVAALGSISVELPLRRLSRAQYLTSLQDAVRQTLPSAGEPIALRIPEIAAAFPADQMINVTRERHGGFTRADQVMQQRHIDAAYTIGVALGTELAGSGRIGALLGSCATDGLASNDDACLRGFIQRFGRIALRAPLTSTQVDLYRRAAGSTPVAPAAVAQVIGLMLSSARFLYVVEQGAPAASEPRTPLTAHELAARMALHFWNGLPDADLNSAADSGQLLVDSVFAAQVARLATHPRAEAGVREFFAQWFRLHELAELDARVGEPVFDAFRAGYLPAADTRENAIAEIGDLVAHLWRTGGTLQEVLTDRRSFARSADIASIYGVPPWNGTAAPVEFPQPERSGLLTRVAFTASGSAITRPIMKGYRIRSALLCQVLPPPPADAMNAVVAISPAQTTREVVEQLTEQPGSSCAACHVSLLNPLGFVTENFDALGRLRTTQRLFDAQGRPVGERPVRTAVTVPINGSAVPVADARQLTQAILASGEFERCFARQYFRFTLGREASAPDVGVLADLEARARAGARLPELLARVALRPEFRTRDFR